MDCEAKHMEDRSNSLRGILSNELLRTSNALAPSKRKGERSKSEGRAPERRRSPEPLALHMERSAPPPVAAPSSPAHALVREERGTKDPAIIIEAHGGLTLKKYSSCNSVTGYEGRKSGNSVNK
ncbi:Protein of unknown function [Gryllus bimaculatus]|nr:Protein of unknown function [Gryllus bimaculatus]